MRHSPPRDAELFRKRCKKLSDDNLLVLRYKRDKKMGKPKSCSVPVKKDGICKACVTILLEAPP
jgi:hypothetical protein